MVVKLAEKSCFLAGDLTHLREIFHPKSDDGEAMFSLAHAYLDVGEKSLPHRLLQSSETYFILEGEGQITIDDQTFVFGKNDTVHVPANAIQSVQNLGSVPLVFLCIVSPPWSAENEEVFSG